MLAFLRHHAVSLAAPEAISFLLFGAAIGAALGALCLLFGRKGLAIVAAGLVIASIDAQSDYFTAWNAKLAGHFAALCLVALWWRDFLTRALPAIGTAVLIAAALGSEAPDTSRFERDLGAAGTSLPLVVHIVLDEHIGIEGIPSEFDPERELENELIQFYTDWGFALHGRAYSRYFDTHDAIPNLLNFDATREPNAYFDRDFERGASLRANAYFDAMRGRGHSIHVYQTDYLDLCDGAGSASVASCFEYVLESPSRLRNLPLSDGDKSRMLTAMYMRLSVTWSRLRTRYRNLRLANSWLELPALDAVRGRVSSVSGMLALDQLREDLRDPERGGLYFAHIASPHYPYSYDAACELRSPASSWLDAGLDGARGAVHNTESSRAERYRLYLDQLRCTTQRLGDLFRQLKQSGHYEAARLVIHGDHGSRITRDKMRAGNRKRTDSRPPRDYIDGFATLFAIKQPGASAVYERAIAPIDILLDAYLVSERAPPDEALSPPAEVLLRPPSGALVRTPLPEFAHGEVLETGRRAAAAAGNRGGTGGAPRAGTAGRPAREDDAE